MGRHFDVDHNSMASGVKVNMLGRFVSSIMRLLRKDSTLVEATINQKHLGVLDCLLMSACVAPAWQVCCWCEARR